MKSAPDPSLLQLAEKARGRGLAIIEADQLPSGEFPAFWATNADLRERTPDPSVFPTAHILCSLVNLDGPHARLIIEKSARFLESEMLPGGMFRFWTRDHAGHLNIPPDVDDTGCVRYALALAGHPQKGTERPARALVLGNRAWNGLFYTWLVRRPGHLFHPAAKEALALIHREPARLAGFFSGPESRPNEIELVVNVNALLWLGEIPQTRAAIRWILRSVRTGGEEKLDRYYQSCYALYYALARCSVAGIKSLDQIRAVVVTRLETWQGPDGSFKGNSLDTGLAANVLAHWAPASPALPRAISYLVASQLPDGSWPPRVVYYAGRKHLRAWGSLSMVNAYCVEALDKYLKIHS